VGWGLFIRLGLPEVTISSHVDMPERQNFIDIQSFYPAGDIFVVVLLILVQTTLTRCPRIDGFLLRARGENSLIDCLCVQQLVTGSEVTYLEG
jgi:hypothetical protein